jgi:hypothetical protein
MKSEKFPTFFFLIQIDFARQYATRGGLVSRHCPSSPAIS